MVMVVSVAMKRWSNVAIVCDLGGVNIISSVHETRYDGLR